MIWSGQNSTMVAVYLGQNARCLLTPPFQCILGGRQSIFRELQRISTLLQQEWNCMMAIPPGSRMKDSPWIRARSSMVTDTIKLYTIFITTIFKE